MDEKLTAVLDEINLKNFRNHESLTIEPDEKLTIIYGKNAAGKTNIIEAIQYLTTGESFRHPTNEELIRFEGSSAAISYKAHEGKRTFETKIFFNTKKEIFLNGNPKSASGIKGIIPAVLFIPDDLNIVKEAPEKRRESIDSIGTQLSTSYYRLKKDYEKVIHQRNAILKEEYIDERTLSSWTESLIALGALFFKNRERLFIRMRNRFLSIYKETFPEENADVLYVPSWKKYLETDMEDPTILIKEALSAAQRDESARRTSLVGPHRDEVIFLIDGKDARRFGSQGQQRTIVLVWKLAEVEVIKEISGKKPVLLLDDVMSELDERRREALIAYIDEPIQTIITTTNTGYFSEEVIQEATMIHV